jgi:hypothetical protein
MLPGSGNRPRYTPEENPKPLEDMEEGGVCRGERSEGKGEKCQSADDLKV